MNTRFNECIERVFRHEDHRYNPADPYSGRLVEHPADPGGLTRLGVTLSVWREWTGNPNAGAVDLKTAHVRVIKELYFDRFWNAVRADDLPLGVDYAVFDYAVNSGPRRAIRALQDIVGAKVDGVIGQETVGKTVAMDQAHVINSLCDARLKFLRALPHYKDFGRGWERRVEEVRRAALADAATRLSVAEVAKTDTAKGAGAVAGAVAAVMPIVEAVRQLVPMFEGLPVWAVGVLAAVSVAAAVWYWRAGRK